MAKTILRIINDNQYDFLLIGIVCQQKNYRLCHELNQRLQLNLTRQKDYEIMNNKRMKTSTFPFFQFTNNDNDVYYVFSNKGKDDFLVPEQHRIDYLMMIRENFKRINEQELLNEIKSISIILAAYPLELKTLKSRDNLIF